MKPAPIADYLDHLGQASAERTRENSPFRPRSLHSLQSAEPQPASVSGAARAIGVVKLQREDRFRPTTLDRPRPMGQANVGDSLVAREAAKAEEMAARLTEAYAHGREEGRAEAWAEAEQQRAADRAEVQEQAAAERTEFRLREYAKLEAAIQAGFAEIGERFEAAVARILSPFLAKEIVKRATDELSKNIARLCAGGSPGLIKIRGPEQVLSRLRERIADLPAEVEYVEDNGVESVVEANVTQIVTELRPWADLLASLDG
jgi:flagellar biosynthesis/type III secretory pathway protein FliH